MLQEAKLIFLVVCVDLLMSLDTSLAINAAVSQIPKERKTLALFGGGSIAILLRVIIIIVFLPLLQLLHNIFINVILGVLILVLAIQIIRDIYSPEEWSEIEGTNFQGRPTRSKRNPWLFAGFITFAYLGSTIDNSIAVVSVTQDFLILAVSIFISGYIILFASSTLNYLVNRFPILFYVISAALIWVSGEDILNDPRILPLIVQLNKSIPGSLIFYIQVIYTLIFATGCYWWWNQHRQHMVYVKPAMMKKNLLKHK